MFKFNFDLDEQDIDEDLAQDGDQSRQDVTSVAASSQAPLKPFKEIDLIDLTKRLPSVISYSPLSFPLSDGSISTVARRDLYDARFEVISQDQHEGTSSTGVSSAEEPTELDFLEAPSDLVSGVYEGGLKTWECSLDLAAFLHGLQSQGKLNLTRILELGCGTAVPSLYLLQTLLSSQSPPQADIDIHLQDYNDLVFRLVTVPNLILTWYMSPASEAFRRSTAENQDGQDQDDDPLPPPDPTISGDLPVSPALIAAFLDSLKQRRIQIRLFTGSWDTFDISHTGGKYGLVLTSETIYRIESLPSLIQLLRRASVGAENERDAETDLVKSTLALTLSSPPLEYTCLVAAKLVYFGVGGGVSEFVEAVEGGRSGHAAGKVETAWEQTSGVKRSIMNVRWV
ncbi:hypothetical protein EIP91_009580 [Steccherinum ochraceum]|uniref:protein-histidine N-methyltransferase n=1 Tax=Steccherinum ochraceum TaxID=92696 RepID=A0A4R0RMK7_9APHY|nr:hypothetical protein EIP91_009580 [Steccherinum ochraceum]